MNKLPKSRTKLSALLASWPKGMVAVHPWLQQHGIPRLLASAYHRSGWVHRIERGAYARLEDKVDWTGGLHAVQYQLDLPVNLGGKRALEFQGYGHFARMREGGTMRLYGPRGTRLPTWFRRHDWCVKLVFTGSDLFVDKMDKGLTERPAGDFPIRLSAPERAMLEFLEDVPRRESFEEARLLMEGLTTLRPDLVQELLEACRSVKAKRLFLFLAEESGHPWVKELDAARLDLGKGKRSIVKGGRLDAKYQITVEPHPDRMTVHESP
ncbi:MAG: type IV toxin-antitoxin system AbiEi family antitoxin [Elusimicrobia bacterium]|nr:type IV toxin-antitoxin system AbiEi family antitoxin [Elusimicrobiota bacterium]